MAYKTQFSDQEAVGSLPAQAKFERGGLHGSFLWRAGGSRTRAIPAKEVGLSTIFWPFRQSI